MDGELRGKVAIVTGGSSGIGLGAVERFLSEGARLVIADIDRERGEKVAADLGRDVAFRHTDVAESEQVTALVAFAVEHFGGCTSCSTTPESPVSATRPCSRTTSPTSDG